MRNQKKIEHIAFVKYYLTGKRLLSNPFMLNEVEFNNIEFERNFPRYYITGKRFLNNAGYLHGVEKTILELQKTPKRTEVLNFLLSRFKRKTIYLEIGVNNPSNNYSHIISDRKYSVDPGYEFIENPVDFKMTSDEFFIKLENNEILSNSIKFDVIFIDGLHVADQVDRDIINSLKHLNQDGFIVLHDCNPPSEWHARESCYYQDTPAGVYWNGSVWKSFLRWRFNDSVKSCCINSDWGIGVLAKKHSIGNSINPSNFFFEYNTLDKNRQELLNLIDYDEFKKMIMEDQFEI